MYLFLQKLQSAGGARADEKRDERREEKHEEKRAEKDERSDEHHARRERHCGAGAVSRPRAVVIRSGDRLSVPICGS